MYTVDDVEDKYKTYLNVLPLT